MFIEFYMIVKTITMYRHRMSNFKNIFLFVRVYDDDDDDDDDDEAQVLKSRARNIP